MSVIRLRPPAPRKVALARTGTPLEPLARTSAALGVEVLVKRDDLTGAELTGNKVRKLEYLLAEAEDQGADTVITCGGEQSNHCRATALAAARLGLACRLILRTDDPAAPPAATGNILLDRLAGATVRWISRPAWADRAALLAEEAEAVRAAGGVPYVIPEGGSNATGSWGYVACAEELVGDLAALPPRPTTVIYACGSGGTGAGLIVGARLHGLAGAPGRRQRVRRPRVLPAGDRPDLRRPHRGGGRSTCRSVPTTSSWSTATSGSATPRAAPRSCHRARPVSTRRPGPRSGLHRQGLPRRRHRAGARSRPVRRAHRLRPHRRHLRPVPGRRRAGPAFGVIRHDQANRYLCG
jgi:hypothetical protein